MPSQTNPVNKDEELREQVAQRLAELPRPVLEAIQSANIEERLRDLSRTHQLHLDQWEKLENEVTMTLLGLQPIESLEKNIRDEVIVSPETARDLAGSISKNIFEPIRQELERELEHPDAKAKELTGVESARADMLGAQKAPEVAPPAPPEPSAPTATPSAPIPVPAAAALPVAGTPPPEKPAGKAVRVPLSSTYKAGEPSSTRKNIHDDPYRESPA